MKFVALILFLLVSFETFSQATTQGSVGIYNNPNGDACSGGIVDIGVRFKFQPGMDGEEVFYFNNTNISNNFLYACKSLKCKEFFGFPKTKVGNDTIYWFTAVISPSVPVGDYLMDVSPPRYPGGKSFKIMTCTGIEEYELNSQIPIYYDLIGNIIDKRYNELIIEQVGLIRRKIFIQK